MLLRPLRLLQLLDESLSKFVNNKSKFVITKELVYIIGNCSIFIGRNFSEYIVFHNMATTDVRYRGAIRFGKFFV